MTPRLISTFTSITMSVPKDTWWDSRLWSPSFFQHRVGVRPSVKGWLDGKREDSGEFLLWVSFTASSHTQHHQ